MTTDNYILLIANTYLENGEKIGYGIETVEIRKELFQQQLIRVQNVEERDNFVTKKEFLNHCLIALHLLKEYVSIEVDIQINYLHTYLKDIKDGKYENEYFSLDNYPVNWKAEEESVKYQIDHFDIDEYLVAMDKLTTGIYKKLCNIDIEFIEEIFNNFSFEIDQPQQPEPEPLDLSETSAVEKIIYLNELGIIDFLKSKPEFTLSTNLMATVLSAITDVKATTLQTSLNRLINNDTADKNHPYRTKKTVDKVRQTLIDKNIRPKAS